LTQLEQGACLDLTHSLPGERHGFADFGEGAGVIVLESETAADHFSFPWRELIQQMFQVVMEGIAGEGLLRCRTAVFEQISQLSVLILADPCLQRDGAGHPHQRHAHGFLTQPQLPGQITHRSQSSLFGGNRLLDALDAIQFFGDMHREANGSALCGDRSGDPLTDPPVGIGAEAEASGGIELLHRPFKAKRALLDEIKQLHTSLLILLGHRHNKPQVGLDHPVPGPASLPKTSLQFFGFKAHLLGPEAVPLIQLTIEFLKG